VGVVISVVLDYARGDALDDESDYESD